MVGLRERGSTRRGEEGRNVNGGTRTAEKKLSSWFFKFLRVTRVGGRNGGARGFSRDNYQAVKIGWLVNA